MTFMKHVAALCAAICCILPANACGQTLGPVGSWRTEDNEMIVRIAPCSPASIQLCGTTVQMSQPNDDQGRPLRDTENPNPALRSRPLLGLTLLSDFHAQGNRWAGQIYDPGSGRTLDSTLRMISGERLEVRGCILVFCVTQHWNRVP